MRDLFYCLIEWIGLVHDRLLTLNDRFPAVLTDKELHFLLFGLLGLVLCWLFGVLLRLCARRGRFVLPALLFALAAVTALAFAVEAAQQLTHTGQGELADVRAGVTGSAVFCGVGVLLRALIRALLRLLRRG